MDWVSAGIGLATSLFGGRKSDPMQYQNAMWQRYNAALDEAMRIYRMTDWKAIDANTLANYKENTMRTADEMQTVNEKRDAAQGWGKQFSDTEKQRRATNIQKGAARDVSNMEAQLAQTRPMRQKGLLPDFSAMTGGLNAAAQSDQWNTANKSAEQMALQGAGLEIAKLLSQGNWWKTKRQAPNPFNMNFIGTGVPGLG